MKGLEDFQNEYMVKVQGGIYKPSFEDIEKIIFDDNKLEQMKENTKKLAMPNAVNDFVSIFYDKFKGR